MDTVFFVCINTHVLPFCFKDVCFMIKSFLFMTTRTVSVSLSLSTELCESEEINRFVLSSNFHPPLPPPLSAFVLSRLCSSDLPFPPSSPLSLLRLSPSSCSSPRGSGVRLGLNFRDLSDCLPFSSEGHDQITVLRYHTLKSRTIRVFEIL